MQNATLAQHAAVLAVLVLPTSSFGSATGFEDLTVGATFPVGSTIISEGVAFDVVSFGSVASFVRVDGFRVPGFQRLFLGNRIGLEFDVPPGTELIALDYEGSCCDAGVIINGVASPLSTGLGGLSGTTLGGVTIAVMSATSAGPNRERPRSSVRSARS